jgi:small subunit ribosomal protein S17e
MGKIKSRLIKRTANTFLKRGINFDEAFEKNKKIIGTVLPSKKIRNQVAGYLSRLQKRKNKKEKKLERAQAN